MTLTSTIVRKKAAKRKPREGVVYLLHFERPLGNLSNPKGQARHYIGWALDLRQRLAEHRNGWGASLTMAAVERDIKFYLVRFWPGTHELERSLKRQKNSPRLCPICRANRTAHATQLLLPLDFNDLETNILSIAPRYTQRPDYTEIAYWRGDHRPVDPPPDRLNEPPEPPELKPWEIPF